MMNLNSGNDMENWTYQIVRKTAQHTLQTFDREVLFGFARLSVKVERPTKNQQNTGNAVVQVKLYPSAQFLS